MSPDLVNNNLAMLPRERWLLSAFHAESSHVHTDQALLSTFATMCTVGKLHFKWRMLFAGVIVCYIYVFVSGVQWVPIPGTHIRPAASLVSGVYQLQREAYREPSSTARITTAKGKCHFNKQVTCQCTSRL